MKLVLLCHDHPDAKYHALIDEERLTVTDYKSRCFVGFVDARSELIVCPRCSETHHHAPEGAIPA